MMYYTHTQYLEYTRETIIENNQKKNIMKGESYKSSHFINKLIHSLMARTKPMMIKK